MKYLGIVIALFLLVGVLFITSFGGIHLQGFLNKERANVDRQVFEETRSFRAGLDSNFTRQWSTYEMADNTAQKQLMCATIKRQFATDYDNLNGLSQRNYDSLPNCTTA